MNPSKFTKTLLVLNSLLILGIIFWLYRLHETRPPRPHANWEPVKEEEINRQTLNLGCGESQLVYTNTGKLVENLVFVFENRCEFLAFAERGDSSETKEQIIIPGYSISPKSNSRQASFELRPGERFSATCTRISTVANEGCTVRWWISARRPRV